MDFAQKTEDMKNFFLDRDYPPEVVDSAINKAKAITREDALADSRPPSDDRPSVNLTYHPHNVPVCRILSSNWHILQDNPKLSEIFDTRPLFSYRRGRNLADELVRGSLRPPPNPSPPGTHACSKPNCHTCPFLSGITFLQGPSGSTRITRTFTCNTVNVVYAIVCQACRKIYIGETGRALSVRLAEHLADIRKDEHKPVAEHFNSNGHSIQDVRALGLWQVKGSAFERKHKEAYLIKHLGTVQPHGMNVQQHY